MGFLQRMVTTIVVATGCLGLAVAMSSGQEFPEPQRVEIPATATVLEGIPTVRIDSAEGGATRRLLERSSSGEFTYLPSDPGHYIRFTRLNDKISYMEHVDLPSGSVTWWGELRIVVGK